MSERTARWWWSVSLCVLASCADPGPVSTDPVAEPSAADVSTPTAAPASHELAPAELSPDEIESFASADDAIAAYRGPRIAVTPNVSAVLAGVPFTLTASLTDADGASVPVDDSMTFTWRLPDGWRIEGGGAEVTVTADALPEGTDPIDVGVAVDRDGARLVRGGVMLAR